MAGLSAIGAFFASSETTVFSLLAEWFETRTATDDPRAHVLKGLHDDPHRLLATLRVGNGGVNVAIASIMTINVAGYRSSGLTIVVTTVVTRLLILVFGEIASRVVGLGSAET